MLSMFQYKEGAEAIKKAVGALKPETLIILGSGLGFMADEAEGIVRVPFADVPHMKTSTAPGHSGCFVAGKLSGKDVLFMQGRLHLYEGHSAEDAAYPVRVAKLLGCRNMIVTNACGGVNTAYRVGQLILLKDFIKFACPNPLIGPNLEGFGPRFCDMSYTFNKDFRKLAMAISREQGLDTEEGVYFYMTGPQYETPAEIRAIRALGGDVVGMSTVPECIAANHCGMKILGISLVTNMAAGVLDRKLTEQEVLDEGKKASVYFSALIREFLNRA